MRPREESQTCLDDGATPNPNLNCQLNYDGHAFAEAKIGDVRRFLVLQKGRGYFPPMPSIGWRIPRVYNAVCDGGKKERDWGHNVQGDARTDDHDGHDGSSTYRMK